MNLRSVHLRQNYAKPTGRNVQRHHERQHGHFGGSNNTVGNTMTYFNADHEILDSWGYTIP